MPIIDSWILVLIALVSVAAAAIIDFGRRQQQRPILTLTVCTVLGLCLVAQILAPELLNLVERSAPQISKGEWWRLATALFFQDGRVAGGVANIAALLIIGGLAEQILTRVQWLVIYFLGALAVEWLALVWQPVGAGNSIGICSLAGSMIVALPWRGGAGRSGVLRIVASGIAAFLLAVRDIHGAAFVAGALCGAGSYGVRRL